MRYDQEHKARVRKRILDEAAKVIRHSGPAGVGIVDTMAAAGLTHGAFYAHFKSRNDLVAETITYMFDERRAELGRGPATGARSAAEVLGPYLDRYLSPAHRDSRERGCPVAFLASDVHRLPDAARERLEVGTASLSRYIGELVAGLPGDGDKPGGAAVLAELVGALLMARALARTPMSDELLVEARRKLKGRLGLEA